MTKRIMHAKAFIGPAVIPDAGRVYFDVAPAYEYVDGVAAGWPVPKQFDLVNGEVTIPDMEDEFAGQPLTWAIRGTVEDGRGRTLYVTPHVTYQFPAGAAGTPVEYTSMVKVDAESTIPGYGPTWAEQARADAEAAEASRVDAEAAQAAAETAAAGAGAAATSAVAPLAAAQILGWANALAFAYRNITRLPSGNINTADITWPDGVVGVWTTDTENTTFQSLTSYHFTRTGTPTVTFTQPTMTLDSTGAVSNQPVLVVS